MVTYVVKVSHAGNQVVEKNNDGIVTIIPTDPANSDYAEYLRYTEWVEAGNDPDEFWTQTEAI